MKDNRTELAPYKTEADILRGKRERRHMCSKMSPGFFLTLVSEAFVGGLDIQDTFRAVPLLERKWKRVGSLMSVKIYRKGVAQ